MRKWRGTVSRIKIARMNGRSFVHNVYRVDVKGNWERIRA